MYKQTMIDKNYIPISIGALNKLLAKRKLPNPPPIPEYWNQKGRPEIMALPTLIDMRVDHEESRVGAGWSLKATEDALFIARKEEAVANGLDPLTVKAPHKKTAATYHSALKSDHDNKTVTSKPKTLLRDVAETSQRSMLSDLTGMLAIRCMVVQPDQAPTCLKFEEDRTTPGCNLARELYAMARGVPKSHVFFSPCQLLINIDDKASMYSAFTGDGTGNGKSSDRPAISCGVNNYQYHRPFNH